jgi:hypothetical protein
LFKRFWTHFVKGIGYKHSDLWIIEISYPENPTLVGSADMPCSANGYVSGNYAYMAAGGVLVIGKKGQYSIAVFLETQSLLEFKLISRLRASIRKIGISCLNTHFSS